MKKKTKIESVAEYMARGGTITVLAPGDRDSQRELVKQVTGGPVKILTYEEAELYLSEGKQRKPVKSKPSSTIDLSALPEALRKKFIDRYGDVNEEETEISGIGIGLKD